MAKKSAEPTEAEIAAFRAEVGQRRLDHLRKAREIAASMGDGKPHRDLVFSVHDLMCEVNNAEVARSFLLKAKDLVAKIAAKIDVPFSDEETVTVARILFDDPDGWNNFLASSAEAREICGTETNAEDILDVYDQVYDPFKDDEDKE